VEELVREVSGKKPEPAPNTVSTTPSASASKEITQLQSSLSSHFGTRVVIKSDGKRGEIKIPFLSVEDLNRILDILKM
jgi:ParB family chromosome partitioning protein